MTQKVSDAQTTNLTYDAENRLVEVKLGDTTIAAFTYDGDGNRVKGVVGGTTTVYIGNYFEWTGSTSTMKKYYYAGAQRAAVPTGSSTLNWLLGDHLGSAMVQTYANGGNPQVNLYKACPTRCARGCSAALREGEPRPNGSLPSPFRFTGQRSEPVLGLYFYNARWYDSSLSRFLQADSLIPGAGNPLAWDRYAYTLNAPTRSQGPLNTSNSATIRIGDCMQRASLCSFQQVRPFGKIEYQPNFSFKGCLALRAGQVRGL